MTAPAPSRAVCPFCGRIFALTKSGRLRWHGARRKAHAKPNNPFYCKGSAVAPLQVVPS